MSSYNLLYLVYIFVISLSQLFIFEKLFENKKYKNKKGTFLNKAKYSIFILLVFMLPILYPFISTSELFDIAKLTIFIGVFCELFISSSSNKLLKYKWGLIILSFYSIVFVPENIYTTLQVALLVVCMDTGMSFFGRFIVCRIPYESCKFRYPDYVSKNKTGLSVLLSYIVNVLIFHHFYDIKLITVICFATFLGDAVFSHYKRVSKVNDFSNLLGPIGGFADRFDGWIFAFFFVSISGIKIAALGVAIFFI